VSRRAGLRLALTTFTVLPVRAGRVDRPAASAAMVLAPMVGAALGALLGGVGVGLTRLGAPVLVAAVLVVVAELLLTRGLHVDGLADTVDALGSYGDRERALRIMRSPEVGPFGVAAIGVVLLLRTGCVAALLQHRPLWSVPVALLVATATGRLTVTWACRRGIPAARPEGLGALVAGSVPTGAALVASVVLVAVALAAVPGRPWQGPIAVVVALAGAELVRAHTTRRLGGITGDVLGALVELGAVLCLVALAFNAPS